MDPAPQPPTLGTNLRRLVALLDAAVDRAYADAGLTFRATFTPVVRALLRAKSLSVRDIAAATGTTHSAASQTVAQMKRAGLLEAAASADQRQRRVALTAACLSQLPALERQWARTQQAAAALDAELEVDLNAVVLAALAALDRRPFLQRAPRRLDPAEQVRATEQVAALIAAHYVFPAAALRIAGELRGLPPQPEPILPAELATALTGALRPRDAHFTVTDGSEQASRRPTSNRADTGAGHEAGFTVTVDDGIAVIDVSLFVDADPATPAGRARADAAKALLQALATADAAILDLRGVPGGAPSMVALLLDHFLPAQPVHLLSFAARAGEAQQSWTPAATDVTRREDVPVYVLIDGDTASAAESCAYALQSLRRGTLIGRRTAGAANPGDRFLTAAGLSVFIPTGAPIDPRTGTNWEGTGVTPDLPTAPDNALVRAYHLTRRASD